MKRILLAVSAFALVEADTASAQNISSPEVQAWLQKTFPTQSSSGNYLISPNVVEKSGSWYCGADKERFSCRTLSVFPSMAISVSKEGKFDVSLTPPAFALKGADDINDITLNFSNGDTEYVRHTWSFIREGDDIRSFIHALTSSKNVTILLNGGTQSWTLPLSGTSRVIDSMAFWAAEHKVSLPAPFYSAEEASVGDDGKVAFHVVSSSSLGDDQATSSSTLPAKKDTHSTSFSKSSEKPLGSCHDDWRACKDTDDLVHNWSDITHVIAQCIIKGNELARYGTPKWGSGWFSGPAFSTYMQGGDTPQSGILTLYEPHATLQNQYGTWVHREAVCVYNLNKEKIFSLFINSGGMEEDLIEPYEDQSALRGTYGR